MKDIIFTEKATAPTAPYSQAIRAGSTVYLAGVCGDDPATGKLMGSGDMTVEAASARENRKTPLEAAGNAVYQRYFPVGHLPARIAMEISRLADGANLELDAIAVLD